MNAYEKLTEKMYLCEAAALRSRGDFRTIWLSHAQMLEIMRDSMTIEEASK